MAETRLTVEGLERFYREVVRADLDRLIDARVSPIHARFDDVMGHFDAVYYRLDRIDHGLTALTADLHRRVDGLEK